MEIMTTTFVLIGSILLLVFTVGSAVVFSNLQSTPPFLAGEFTTVDGVLTELEIDMTILRVPTNGGKEYIVPRLKRIIYENEAVVAEMETAGDEYTITITPDSHAAGAHPHINDPDCMFKDRIFQQLASAATNTSIGQWHCVKTGYINRGVVITSSIFVQVTLDGTAQVFHFLIEFEWIKISFWEVAAQWMAQGLML